MAYSRGFLNKRVGVLTRAQAVDTDFGKAGGQFTLSLTIWANVAFVRGQKPLKEGAVDAYEILMVRCDWHSALKRECRLSIDGKTYLIQSFNADRERNEMQITCVELQK